MKHRKHFIQTVHLIYYPVREETTCIQDSNVTTARFTVLFSCVYVRRHDKYPVAI